MADEARMESLEKKLDRALREINDLKRSIEVLTQISRNIASKVR